MVKDLESQVSKQKTDTKDQEAELAKVKAELSALKQQEASLRQEFKVERYVTADALTVI